MCADQPNKRETGARKYPAVSAARTSAKSRDPALSKHKKQYGLTESSDDTEEKTRHSDGQNPSRSTPGGPATEKEKTSGAGPALSKHSKDAKTPKVGRRPGS